MRLIPLILVTMKRCLFLVLASCLMFAAKAQRVYFIYLQSENAAPFFVKMGDKVYSSTSTGYVILSNLKDSTYNFSVGFPGGKVAEKRFAVPINQGDRGFLIKNFEEGLRLFDLQSLGVIKAIAQTDLSGNTQVIARTDPFTRLLSEAADDASLLTTTVVVKTDAPKKEVKKEPDTAVKPDVALEQKGEPKSDVVAAVDSLAVKTAPEKAAVETAKTTEPPEKEVPAKDSAVAVAPVKKEEVKAEETKTGVAKEDARKDTAVILTTQPAEPADKTEELQAETAKTEPATYYKRSTIIKRSESSTTEGFGLVYLDHQEEGVDTIRLLIPNPKKAFVEEVVKESETQKPEEPVKADPQIKAEEQTTNPEDPKISETSKAVAEKSAEKRTIKGLTSGLFKSPKAAAPAPAPAVENTSCQALATEKDFLKVRKNMAAETNDEAMIDAAKVFFRSKCFTTEQIKNLSTLFLTSAAKYQFFDAAFRHVTDPSQFPTLQSEIKDAYYLKRFQALIGQ
jgi:hypothetical protein